MFRSIQLIAFVAAIVGCTGLLQSLGKCQSLVNTGNGVRRSITSLFAHHVNKKITKRMMDRRPKKSRPSDINRNNINQDKCITKVENAPDEYTLLSAEEFLAEGDKVFQFWEHGDPFAPWLEITPEDELTTLNNNREPPPPGTRKKGPPLLRSGTGG